MFGPPTPWNTWRYPLAAGVAGLVIAVMIVLSDVSLGGAARIIVGVLIGLSLVMLLVALAALVRQRRTAARR